MTRNSNSLPIISAIPELKQALAGGTTAVLAAPPGAGKTTAVPLALLDEPWLDGKKIIILEPRRLATRAAARRMSQMLKEKVGQTVGYRIRLERSVSRATRIEVVTEGILTRQLQNDPALDGVGLVIFDEFHERSIHADTGLAFCLDAQEGLREDLRLLIMSATLDTESVSRLLKNAPVIESQGRQFPVETRYLPGPTTQYMDQRVAAAIMKALREETGSILVFLPGVREIKQVENRLAKADLGRSISVAPLYGNLPRVAQDLAIEPAASGFRKIVLATAIAETSLTIEGIRIVIDAGQMRVPRFDIRSGMTRLKTIRVNRDAADQRRGRAGRIESGICYRLWSKEMHHSLVRHGSPELLNTDLTPLALELALWGVSDPLKLAWLDPPPQAAFDQARNLLTQLGALGLDGQVTEHGKAFAALGLHPRLAHMVLAGRKLAMGALACEVAALLSERDILRARPEARDVDLRLRVEALRAYQAKQRCDIPGMTLDLPTCRRVGQLANRLKSRLKCMDNDKHLGGTGVLLAFAYPDRIAVRRPEQALRFQLVTGREAYFPTPEPLSAANYLVAADLDGVEQAAMIYLAAPISIDALSEHFGKQITEHSLIDWNQRKQAVRTRRQIRMGKAVLKNFPLPNPDPDQVGQAMCDGIRRMGIDSLPWTKQLRAWQARVMLLKRLEAGGVNWPDISDEQLTQNLEHWLLPFLSGISRRGQLARLQLKTAMQAMLSWQHQQALDRLAPTHFTVPSGSRIPIDYTNSEAPVLAVRLQEMFGATETPTIAGGNLALLLHLLSPAGRPVQVTRDLNSFWEKAYYDVKSDLMGRYPKHYWPDNPLLATPTNRTKKSNRP